TGATSVKFGSIEASFTVVSDSSVTATVPPLAPPLATISVTTPLGTFASPTAFKVTPAITGLSALSGEVGDTVTIIGTSFTGATSVKFGTVADSTFTVDDDFQITAHVPAGALTAKITVMTPAGTATSVVSFGVRPTITSFAPSSGAAGTAVTITGKTFSGGRKI